MSGLRFLMSGGSTPESQDLVKARGAHYTPPALAAFLADTILAEFGPQPESLRVLDPACGDGSLLLAMGDAVPASARAHLHLMGFDSHEEAIRNSRNALSRLEVGSIVLRATDFLSEAGLESPSQRILNLEANSHGASLAGAFDSVIANPPYVRTQVLGSKKAQLLAQRYGLSGRVDLYHAFLKAIATSLRDNGVLGLLTSNRFLVTQAGAAMREALQQDFDLLQVIDLGDTKLFSAAVLPAIALARRRSSPRATQSTRFTRVYEVRGADPCREAKPYPSILDALRQSEEGSVRVDERCFSIERGTLKTSPDASRPWVLSSHRTDSWSQVVAAHTACRFGDMSKVRVGIKTTADPVFIRSDWNSLDLEIRPESELLRPLLTHHVAASWRSEPSSVDLMVLYPHTTAAGKRVPADLDRYPRARAYLELHRERLSSRKYVLEAGRRWYELWVPQQPADWANPKIVFPDISEQPRFFLDEEGAVVNGDCYWITLPRGSTDAWPMLMLAIANSSFIEQYYDTMFNNKLYAGRRRFLTQYVERFPLPDPDSTLAKKVVRLARERLTLARSNELQNRELSRELNDLVWTLFGLVEETRRERDLELLV